MFAAAALAVWSSSARGGQEGSLDLSWRAPQSCPTKSEVESQVHELLGGSVQSTTVVSARVHAWRGEDALWHVEVRTVVDGRPGERRVDGESCEAVAQAASLILAMAVDPEAVAAAAMKHEQRAVDWDPHERPDPLAVGPLPATDLVAAPLPVVPLVEKLVPPEPVGVYVGPAAGVDVGTLPALAPWVGGSLGIDRGGSRLEARVAFLAEQTEELGQPRAAGGRFALTAFGLWACHVVVGPSPSLDLCGGIETGILHAEGFGVTDPGEADPAWLSVTPSVVTRWPLSGWLSLRSDLSIGVPLRRPAFELEPYGDVHRAAPVVGRVSVGPEIDFP